MAEYGGRFVLLSDTLDIYTKRPNSHGHKPENDQSGCLRSTLRIYESFGLYNNKEFIIHKARSMPKMQRRVLVILKSIPLGSNGEEVLAKQIILWLRHNNNLVDIVLLDNSLPLGYIAPQYLASSNNFCIRENAHDKMINHM